MRLSWLHYADPDADDRLAREEAREARERQIRRDKRLKARKRPKPAKHAPQIVASPTGDHMATPPNEID